jgi:hypothetical protein
MAISEKVFKKFTHYLNYGSSIIELGNQTFTNECISYWNEDLKGYVNTTPVKNFCEKNGFFHVSIDITGFDNSLPYDLNSPTIPIDSKFDIVTNFGTTEHIEPNQYEPFLHIHNLCNMGGLMIHEVPVVGHWNGHCKFYYDENFFQYLSKINNYEIIEMDRINYPGPGDLLFVVMRKNSNIFVSNKDDLENKIHISDIEINIPEYWKNK